ncbi:MAG: glutathione S-transferase family protein [Myxococcota bacterium]
MKPPVLWHFRGSHFNEKVRWALDFKGIPHLRRTLGASYLPRALWKTGRPTLPVLLIDGKGIGDSTRIIEALELLEPEPALYPADAAERRRALELEEFFDEELGHPLRSAALHEPLSEDPDFMAEFWSLGLGSGTRRLMRTIFPLMTRFYRLRHRIDSSSAEAGRVKIELALDRVVAELQPSGYLVGDRFSVADLTAASLFGVTACPELLEYAVPSRLPPSLVALNELVSGHAAGSWVTEMYRRHRGKSAELAA